MTAELATTAPVRRPRRQALLAAALVVLYLAGTAVSTVLERRGGFQDDPFEGLVFFVAFGWFVLLAALLTWRQPENPLRWIFVTIAVAISVLPIPPTYVDVRLEEGAAATSLLALLAWPNNWYWYLLLGLMFGFLPLLFPDGQLLSRRWRPVAWVAGGSVAAVCVLGMVAEEVRTQEGGHVLRNPLGIEGFSSPEETVIGGVLFGGLVLALLASLLSLFLRLRRAQGRERLQVKWVLFASAVVGLTIAIEVVVPEVPDPVEVALTAIEFNALPLAITVAILRHRLYAIDRIVSRTISYAVVVAVLVGVYAAGVVGFGGIIRTVAGGGGGEGVVAGSTLLVAASFQPLRRRVQSVVDRRFNRARYDAQRTISEFAYGLRDEVDAERLAAAVRDTAARAIEPAHASVWLVPRG